MPSLNGIGHALSEKATLSFSFFPLALWLVLIFSPSLSPAIYRIPPSMSFLIILRFLSCRSAIYYHMWQVHLKGLIPSRLLRHIFVGSSSLSLTYKRVRLRRLLVAASMCL